MSDLPAFDGPAEPAAPRRDADDERPRRRVRWGRLLLVFGPLLALGLYLARAPLLGRIPPLLEAHDEPREADALVVLGGDHRGGRVAHAVALWERGLVPRGPFVTSGGQLYDELTWGKVMKAHAVRLGVPAERIVAQTESATTDEDARLTLPLLVERGCKTVLLVTDAWHSGRAAAAFRREAAAHGVEVLSCPAPAPAVERWWEEPEAARYVASELLKRVY